MVLDARRQAHLNILPEGPDDEKLRLMMLKDWEYIRETTPEERRLQMEDDETKAFWAERDVDCQCNCDFWGEEEFQQMEEHLQHVNSEEEVNCRCKQCGDGLCRRTFSLVGAYISWARTHQVLCKECTGHNS